MYHINKSSSNVVFWMCSRGGSTYLQAVYNYYTNGTYKGIVNKLSLSNTSDIIARGNLKHVWFIRNPYEKVLSAFIYNYIFINKDETGLFGNDLTFDFFIKNIDNTFYDFDPHILPQTFLHKSVAPLSGVKFDKIIDIIDIDYKYLDDLFGVIFPDAHKGIINTIHGDTGIYSDVIENKHLLTKKQILNILSKKGMSFNYQSFYNNELINKCNEVYKDDFELFKIYGFNYKLDKK